MTDNSLSLSSTTTTMDKDASSFTYEGTRAKQSTLNQPDKIHWSSSHAYRSQPFRQLHHQRGLIGTFTVRLLEASDLQRSYWSALALGPMKHLGLSKAHGAISSYCVLQLVPGTNGCKSTAGGGSSLQHKSPVVANNNDPVWTGSVYSFPFQKGFLNTASATTTTTRADDNTLCLQVQVLEDATKAEQVVLTSGMPGLVPSPDDRLIGSGTLNLSSLLLGHDLNTGKASAGVLDAWIPISKQQQQQQQGKNDSTATTTKSITGQVRVLVSYEPHGMEPQVHDLVALEAHARRSVLRSSCPPILSPLAPLRVLDVKANYLLCEYTMPTIHTNTTRRRTTNNTSNNSSNKATIRIHRNAVFVIERTNIIDATVNVALMPTDFFFSTPVGRTTAHLCQPLVQAGGELLQPAWLTTRVLWAAVRTTTLASMTGVQAAGHALWNQSVVNAVEQSNHAASLSSHHHSNSVDDDEQEGGGGIASSQHLFV